MVLTSQEEAWYPLHSNKPLFLLSEHTGVISGLRALEWETTEHWLDHRKSLAAGDGRDPSRKIPRKTRTKEGGILYRGVQAWGRPGWRGKQQLCRCLNLVAGKTEALGRLMAT